MPQYKIIEGQEGMKGTDDGTVLNYDVADQLSRIKKVIAIGRHYTFFNFQSLCHHAARSVHAKDLSRHPYHGLRSRNIWTEKRTIVLSERH